MKALSLKQPYAELVVSGKKTIELRKWNTKLRGKFLIHASKIPVREDMKKFGFDSLPLGCIVGEVELEDVKKYSGKTECASDEKKHLASGDWGYYGFILKNAKRVKQIKCKGSLNFWNYNFKKVLGAKKNSKTIKVLGVKKRNPKTNKNL